MANKTFKKISAQIPATPQNKKRSFLSKYKDLHSRAAQNTLILFISHILFILGVVSTVLTIKDSMLNSYERKYGTDKAALEFYRKGIKYYNDDNYVDAIKNFESAYHINENLLKTKYYYVICLLQVDVEENLAFSRKILYEHSEYLDDDEKALYGVIEAYLGDHAKSTKIFSTIADYLGLDNHAFYLYIIADTENAFDTGYYEGAARVSRNDLLIRRKLEIVGFPSELSSDIRKFSEDEVLIETDILFRHISDKYTYKIKELMIRIYSDYCAESREHQIYDRLLPTLLIASEYFEVFQTTYDINRAYLDNLYFYLEFVSILQETELDDLKVILTRLIEKLENGSRAYADDLEKCKQIYNKLIIQYRLGWDKYID